MTKLAYPGTFNPFTDGHLYVVNRALEIADEVHIIIAQNPTKTNVNHNANKTAIEAQFSKNTKVKVHLLDDSEQFVAEYAKSIGCTAIIRGIRNSVDFEAEAELSHINETVVSNIPTFHIIPPASMTGVSSTVVRNITGKKNWHKIIKNMIPDEIYKHYVFAQLQKHTPLDMYEYFLKIKDNGYHNIEHSLRIFNQCKNHIDLRDLVEACVIHDAVDTLPTYSKFDDDANQYYSVCDITENAQRMISDTWYGKNDLNYNSKKRSSSRIFTDADLSILWSDPDDYLEYSNNVALEYNHIERSKYVEGRRKFLESVKSLCENNMFYTPDRTIEEKVIRNIDLELSVVT